MVILMKNTLGRNKYIIFLLRKIFDFLVLMFIVNFSICFSHAEYFQELSRISSEPIVRVKDMVITDDGGFVLVLSCSSGENR